MFLVNSRLGSFAAPRRDAGEALFRSYDRCFAEFLNEGSLVHLRILTPPTCVGLRYGLHTISSPCLFLAPSYGSSFHPKASLPPPTLRSSARKPQRQTRKNAQGNALSRVLDKILSSRPPGLLRTNAKHWRNVDSHTTIPHEDASAV